MSHSLLPSAWVTEKVANLLEAMAATGLWGDSTADVVTHLVYDGVQRAIGKGLIPPAPEFAEVEMPSSTPDACVLQPSAYSCQNCEDGFKIPADFKDGRCPKCGNDCIPF